MAPKKRVRKKPAPDSALKDPVIKKFHAEQTPPPKPDLNKKPIELPKVVWTPGRPTEYRMEFCTLLIWHMSQGLSFETFGAMDEVMVGRATLYRWLDAQPEFRDAKTMGEAKCREWWEKLGNRYSVNNLRGSGESLNAAVYRINMQNRFGWMEKSAVADGGKVNLHDAIMDDLEKGDADVDEG